MRRTVGAGAAVVLLFVAAPACETVDPGPNFVISDDTFDQNYFFCHVEPEYLFANNCGPGDPSKGDTGTGCHFNSSAVSGMALIQHDPIPCTDEKPDLTQVGAGSPAQSNFQAASLEMNRDYTTAPIVVRPSGANHPRAVVQLTDPSVQIIATWAQK